MAMQRNKAEFFKTFRLILMKGSFLLYWAFSEANPEKNIGDRFRHRWVAQPPVFSLKRRGGPIR
jgi:hypothetical protein